MPMKVIVVTPNAADKGLAEGFLAEHGIEARGCTSIASLLAQLDEDVACVVMVEEALLEHEVGMLHEVIRTQPPWSDLPLLLLAAQESSLAAFAETVFPYSGNVTVLQRPLHPVSLVSSVNVALRARARQLQVRDLLAQREGAVKRRDEFLAMLAHELRNPLAPIRNAVYLLGSLDIVDPLFVKCRAMIDKQAGHITRLVDDLLDVSRLELGKVELRPQRVDLNDTVAAAVEACAPMTSAQRHRVELRLARTALPVRADPVRLEQAIGNLVVNAAKFTPAGGSIVVEARAEDGHGVVAVTDNGVGIKAEMLESIFELFTQDEVALARSQGGLGIGLTLVKRLVELHGGTVRAMSAGLGAGSTFEARLPLAAREAHPVVAREREILATGPRRVLIVEDGADNRESLGTLLAAWNHEVIYACDGPEGVRRACEEQPDVALIDIGLPGFDGYEVARKIRHECSGWRHGVQLVALTGYGQADDRARAIEAGFDTHLLKPVDPALLRGLLAKGTAARARRRGR